MSEDEEEQQEGGRVNYHPHISGLTLAEIRQTVPKLAKSETQICYVYSYHDQIYEGVCVYQHALCWFLIMEEDAQTGLSSFAVLGKPVAELKRAMYPLLWWWVLDEDGRPNRGDSASSLGPPYWFERFWHTTPERKESCVLAWYETA